MTEIFQDHDQDEPKLKYTDSRFDAKTGLAVLSGLAVLVLVAGGIWYKSSKDAEHARALKDTELEGLLRGRKFDELGTGIDVSGGAKKLYVSCTPPDPTTGEIDNSSGISFFLDDTGSVAELPLNDANGQYLGDANRQEFAIGSSEDIQAFVGGFVADTCAILSQE